MSQATPVRIILSYREQPFQNLTAIINAFFTWRGIQPLEDYYTHICGDPRSTRLYLVLDLHCKAHSNVDLNKLDLEVFKVSGIDSLCVRSLFYDINKLTIFSTLKDLGEVARKQAHQRSTSLDWGKGNLSSQKS